MKEDIQGAQHEIDFWKGFVQTDRFLKDWLSDEVTSELQECQPFVVDSIKHKLEQNPDCKVLDLGSGVVSILKGLVPNKNLLTTDLLANQYKDFFNYEQHGLLRPIPLAVEGLHYIESFDIVHMRNALDHSQDPEEGLNKMMIAAKLGGMVIVHGFVDEALAEDWKGFHQWNMDVDSKGNLCCTGKEKSFIRKSNHYYQKYKLSTGKEWFVWTYQK